MRVFIALTLLFASLMPMILAQSSTATVYVEDSTYPGDWGYFSTHFVGIKLDSGGSSHVTFHGGDLATWDYCLSFSDEIQGTVFGVGDDKNVYITATGTYWIYLAQQFSTNNYDWIEIRVVANSFSGTITSLYSNIPPNYWWYGWPPLGTHMMVANGDETPKPPASQAPAMNIKSWLVPLLIVIIVATIAIPSTIYLIKRRNAKKLAALTATNTPVQDQEISSHNHQDVNVQMHEVRV